MLGSGSAGNATVISAGATHLLIDCGFPARETARRLERLGLSPDQLAGVLVTHEHGDHLGGVGPFARRYRLPVWLTTGTLSVWNNPAPDIRIVNPHGASFTIGELEIQPYPVPHDAREPSQFVFSSSGRRLGLLSDAGCITPHMRSVLDGCDALLLECNHDVEALENGPYPYALKRRVGGDRGHLSNAQAASLLATIDCSRLRHLALIHLSETNNAPALALAAVTRALGGDLDCMPDWLSCADQTEGLGWRELS